jgi:hypothetical protein
MNAFSEISGPGDEGLYFRYFHFVVLAKVKVFLTLGTII